MGASSFLVLGASILSWALLLVVSRGVLIALELNPWLFTFIQMMAGGAFLIAIAGHRAGLMEALRNPYTWLYGVLRVATAAFFTAALVHTTTANAAFLGIVSVPISMTVLWLVLSRQPSRLELPGHAVILLGLALLAQSLEDGWRNPALILMILSELCVVASTLIAERHPLNRTDDTRQRAHLTGVMLLASAFFMLSVALSLGFLVRWLPGLRFVVPVDLAWVANPDLALDSDLWISAGLVGVLLRGPSQFLSLKAIHRVRTENYIAGVAALPFMSLALEAAAAAPGWLVSVPATGTATLFGAVMTLGSLGVLWARSKKALASSPSSSRATARRRGR